MNQNASIAPRPAAGPGEGGEQPDLARARSDLAASQLALSETLEAAAFLQSVLDASADCIKVLTLDGEILYMNANGQKVMEVDDFESIRGCAWREFWEGEGRLAAEAALQAAREGRTGNFQGTASTAKGRPKYWDVTVMHLPARDGHDDRILSFSRDITGAKEIEEQKDLLTRELGHRIKNSLSVVQAIASQTFKGADAQKMREFNGRLAALGAAQALLLETAWESVSVRPLIEKTLAPMCPFGRITLEIDDHQLEARRGLALALALHELGTNAVKYGALSVDSGRVRVDLTARDGKFRLTWRETGGPPVRQPELIGFGTRLITRNLESDFDGTVDLNFLPSGVVLELTAPL